MSFHSSHKIVIEPSTYLGYELTLFYYQEGGYEASAERQGRPRITGRTVDSVIHQISERERLCVRLKKPVKALLKSAGSRSYERVEILEIVGDSMTYRVEKTKETKPGRLSDLQVTDSGYQRDEWYQATNKNSAKLRKADELATQINALSLERSNVLKSLDRLLTADVLKPKQPKGKA